MDKLISEFSRDMIKIIIKCYQNHYLCFLGRVSLKLGPMVISLFNELIRIIDLGCFIWENVEKLRKYHDVEKKIFSAKKSKT